LEEMDFSGRRVLLKMDYLFPTGSYKDRGATVLVSMAKELGVNRVVEDSSGNAGAAMAAYCARAGIRCEIYVPEDTGPEKLVQIQTYGSRVKKVAGSRERTAEVTLKAAERTYYASHCWNPFFLHGTKTFAFEIWEQMGWKAPGALVLPVGHGTLFLGSYIGFRELKESGFIEKIPKLVGIQAAFCDPLYQSLQKGEKEAVAIEKKETMAEGIAIAKPIRGKQILEAIRETGGDIVPVTEMEIGVALREVGRRGHYVEPTAASTIAGLKKYLRESPQREVVVSTLTGAGLKATGKIGHLLAGSKK